MKRKVRTISVNQQKFVWWYTIDNYVTKVYLSPFEDKTSKVIVVFPDVIPSLYGQYNESIVVSYGNENESIAVTKENYVCLALVHGFELYNESIVISKEKTECCIKIVAPKMAGFLLDYFTKQKNMFVTRKSIVLNGYDLFSQMGYHIIEIKKGLCW